ncbi:MAG: hypothetical protein Ct9H300mP9_3230 [Candidatus Neomarinimicrobiota bacterium]|nr:MAG: hypothetical protein Ct9H300mP9_3230 [Candidatus Neomarinimicrobiota bacterium]
MCELSRIADHLLNVGMFGSGPGGNDRFSLFGFRLREDIYDLF